MKPDLTPAKPWGFHLTGHLNLPHSAGLEGKRVSKELMEKGKKKRARYREDPCQHECSADPAPANSAPTQLSPYSTHLTSLHCKSSGVKDFRRKWGKCCTSYFVSNSQNTRFFRVVFGDSAVCGEAYCASF